MRGESLKRRVCVLLFGLPLMMAAAYADTIYLKDGQSVEGTFLGGTAEMVRFRVSGLIKSYPVRDIQDIQFGSSSESSASQPAPRTAPANSSFEGSPGRSSPPAPALARTGSGSARTAPPAVASGEYRFPAGTVLRVRTDELIDSEDARVGDLFSATLDQDLVLDRSVVAERGASARLRIGQVDQAGEFKGRTLLVLDLVELTVNGYAVALNATPVEEHGEAQGKKAAGTVGGAAAVGAIIGAIAGGGKGAAIGATVGAGSGAAIQVLTRGEKLKVPAETVLEFTLQRELVVRR